MYVPVHLHFLTLLNKGQTFSKLINHYFCRNCHTTKRNIFTICLNFQTPHTKQTKNSHTCTNSFVSIYF